MSYKNQQVVVSDANRLFFTKAGAYQMDEAGEIEQKVAKLCLLSHFVELVAEDYSCSGEQRVILGTEIEQLANRLYSEYERFIVNGVNIFDHISYFDPKQLAIYQQRPIVGKRMNRGIGEQCDVPQGWFYNFPGAMSKTFEIGHVIIDKEGETYRIGIYDNDPEVEESIGWHEITTVADMCELYDLYPDIADKLIDAIRFIRENEKI